MMGGPIERTAGRAGLNAGRRQFHVGFQVAPLKRRTTTREIAARLRSALSGRDDLAAVWLFGSRARGTERASSDVDVAILLREDPPVTLDGLMLDLQDDLAGELGRPVDLVVMNHAPADLVHRVLRDGELLIENDRSRRVRFEVARRAEYFDLLPILQRYRRVGVNP